MGDPATSAIYRRFARVEAAGRSPVYAEITDRISRDPRMLDFLATLPPPKRQPNLLLAAVLMYVNDPADRERFAATMASSPAVWLANEAPERLPAAVGTHPEGTFLLCRDGRPLARTDPHGSRIDWL